jgi:hypothetical protein
MSEYGDNIIKELESLRQKITKDFPYELKIEEYTDKVANLLASISPNSAL